MASTYTIEDHVSHKAITYHLSKTAHIAFWVVIFASVFQLLVIWVLIGGGEAFLGLRLVDEPLPVVEYSSYLLLFILLAEIVTVYVLGWAMIAERSLQYGVNGLNYISTLWGWTREKRFDLSQIEGFTVNKTSNKGNDFYTLALVKGNKNVSISPNLSREDTEALVDLMSVYKAKNL